MISIMATPKHRHQRPQHLRIAFALALGLIFSLLVIDAAHAQRVTLAARNLTEADTATNTLDAGNSPARPLQPPPRSTEPQPADLKQPLAIQLDSASPTYRQWFTHPPAGRHPLRHRR